MTQKRSLTLDHELFYFRQQWFNYHGSIADQNVKTKKENLKMAVKLSADQKTKQKLGLSGEVISDSEAKQIVERLADDQEYKAEMSHEQLVIKRFLRD